VDISNKLIGLNQDVEIALFVVELYQTLRKYGCIELKHRPVLSKHSSIEYISWIRNLPQSSGGLTKDI
jgi:hypothetical protein